MCVGTSEKYTQYYVSLFADYSENLCCVSRKLSKIGRSSIVSIFTVHCTVHIFGIMIFVCDIHLIIIIIIMWMRIHIIPNKYTIAYKEDIHTRQDSRYDER